ncbi:proteasome inhibitor PI31 subunit [Seriola lalandi dorsalis]|uniref:Proteasome inhibitor PI31 subunit n=1 Tax=Seriola lalandi dorsalis TaxID=1841481 RepID=A0A3B4WZL4_SERLL|nr:proteasome inhibitor PI31 subunit [Seriola lalandi dorsalis]XP_056252516.1 proteasome inhibitor PI31 subunit [Seriola aureovittata]
MAGLEVLYTCVAGSITCPQDAVVCFVHWEMIKNGFRCVGSGDVPLSSDKKSELLPADWSSNKELYSLRYKPSDSDTQLLLKAISVDSTLIFNLMNSSTQQVSDLTVNISDHVNTEQLRTFDSVFKDADSLSEKVKTQLLPPQDRPTGQRAEKTRRREEEEEEQRRRREDSDPLRMPSRHPRQGTQPHWPDPMVPPFAAGGADLDPFGSRGGGGMIVDPLRSGYPRSGFDPSSGIPDILPPGAVPPGARFDPFGPVGRHRPGPDPDHMPPPGYDDMFM